MSLRDVWPATERQRLFAEQTLRDDVPRLFEVEAVRSSDVGHVDYNLIDVLHQLQPLESILMHNAHTLPDNLEEIHDLKRPLQFMAAEIAMTGVVYPCERRHTRIGRGLEQPGMKRSFVSRQRLQGVTHPTDARLSEINEFDAGNSAQNSLRGGAYTRNSGVFVQTDPLLNALC